MKRKGWARDVVKAARGNHIWVNAFSCVRPTEQFCADLGRTVLRMLDTNTIESEWQLVGNERELVLRVNKS